MKLLLCLLLVIVTCGCFQAHSEDDLRAVPVTNNPNIIPNSHMAHRQNPLGGPPTR